MKKLVYAVITAVVLATPLYAQSGKLTEVEQLKIQILNLQIQLRDEQANAAKWIANYGQCQVSLLGNQSALVNATQGLQTEINKNHPEFDFNIRTGEFKPKKPVEKK